jgi:NAD(P)-dependent dehydrogenase (short-subunit alcohol dehydrogenase family)
MAQDRLLVIGATGNIGSAALALSRYMGYEAEGFSRYAPSPLASIDARNYDQVCGFLSGREGYDLILFAQGVQQPKGLETLTVAGWDAIRGSNLDASVITTLALIQKEKIRENGLLVYFSSIQASNPRCGRAAYAAAKGGLESFMRAVAVELAPNARAVVLRLGQLTSGMAGISFTEEEYGALEERTLRGFTTPREAALFAFSLRRDVPHLTGAVISLDGGHQLNVW